MLCELAAPKRVGRWQKTLKLLSHMGTWVGTENGNLKYSRALYV